MSAARWLTLIGIGEDGIPGIPPAAHQRLREARTVFGGERHLALLDPDIRAAVDCIPWPSPMREGLDRVEARRGRPTCVLASGDPFWYGVGATLAARIPPEEMEVFPAPSAFTLAAARQGWPLQEVRCRSAHGRDRLALRRDIAPGRRLLVLSWDRSTPYELGRQLAEDGFGSSELWVLERLGHPEREQRRYGLAREWAQSGEAADPPVADLNTVAVLCCADGPRPALGARVAGRPEDAFEHDGQITKSEVRAVTLAKLAPACGELLWDLGAGSGAVAIEWMRAARDNRAVAVEADPARCERIARNASHHGVPELRVECAELPEGLPEDEPPDAVFIGGGLNAPDLIEMCLARLRPGGRLVANSVTAEGEAVLVGAMQRHGGALTRVQVERTEPLGSRTGWRPLRTVTIWSRWS